jgi:hypothetical protein
MTRTLVLFFGLLACKSSQDDTGIETPVEVQIDRLQVQILDSMGSIPLVSWEQSGSAPVVIRYRLPGETWRSTPETIRSPGDQEAHLLGIPFGTDVEWQLLWEDDCGAHTAQGESIRTEDLPDGAPEIIERIGDEGDWDPAIEFFLTSMDPSTVKDDVYVFIIDRQGRIVWLHEVPPTRTSLHPRVSLDQKSLLIDHGSFWSQFDGGAASQVLRLRIDGTVRETLETPGLHHPFTDLEDGSLVWAAWKSGSETLEVLSPEGVQSTLWDCQTYFESIDSSEVCASNSLSWNPDRDVFLYSLYSVETVLEIDRTSGELLSSFGGFGDVWDFDPAESRFFWQHGAHFLENGHLLLSGQTAEGEEGVAREYSLDRESQILREVWSISQGVETATMGEVHRLPSGHTLHNYGSTTRLHEYTADGEIVWELVWDGEFIGRSTPLEDLYALESW